ncbi:MAG TPA: hypothetical protein VKU00_18825 [Chthonomonadaceae bacterium]|nr:hypothetical protein [Chthonomonadaceae bacterium]
MGDELTGRATDVAPLTREEKERLQEQESVIQANLYGWRQVMQAFHIIYQENLYRGYGSFPEYVRRQWGDVWTDLSRMSNSRLYRLAEAGEAIADVKDYFEKQSELPNGLKPQAERPQLDVLLPANERQARELLKAPRHQRGQIFEGALRIAGNRPLTARHIEIVRKQLNPPPPRRLDFGEPCSASSSAPPHAVTIADTPASAVPGCSPNVKSLTFHAGVGKIVLRVTSGQLNIPVWITLQALANAGAVTLGDDEA